MSGEVCESTRAQRKLSREQRLLEFVREKIPVRTVALMEVIDPDYAYKLLRKVASDHGLDYAPGRNSGSTPKIIPGLTEQSQLLRSRLADRLYDLNLSVQEAALRIGIKAKAQQSAKDRPFNYDWSLSQIERLATEAGVPFKTLLLQALEERPKVRAA